MTVDQDHFMGLALEQARLSLEGGNMGVGSVIVKGGKVIGAGGNRAASDMDPTAHAETVAIRDACRNLGSVDLSGCTCYTTVEPCPMCCWAIVTAGMERLVVGVRFSDLTNADVGGYALEKLLAIAGKSLEITAHVRADECRRFRDAS